MRVPIASIQSPAQERSLAQNHAGAVRLSGVKKKNSYLQAQFYRIKVQRNPKKAIITVTTSILTAIYHMLKD